MSILLIIRYSKINHCTHSPKWLEGIGIYCLIVSLSGVLVATQLLIQSHWNIPLPVAFFGLTQNYIAFLGLILICTLFNHAAIHKYEYTSLNLSPQQPHSQTIKPKYITQLEHIINEQKQFKNPDLSLELLAKEMDISARTLSSIINGHYKCSFVEFVNSYRLIEAKRLLMQDKNKAVLDIMYAAGFSSKATFNAMFKRVEGLTPSQYRKESA